MSVQLGRISLDHQPWLHRNRGELIDVRIARPTDAAEVQRIYAPIVEETAISFEATVPSEAELAAKIEKLVAGHPWLVATDPGSGQVLGYAYAAPHRARVAYQWATEVSVYVGDAAQRRGVGRRLYDVLLACLREQGFRWAYAGITLPNVPSATLHERLGFTHFANFERIGYKFGAWHSVGWWQLDLTPSSGGEGEPPAPIPFATFRESARCTELLGS